MTENQKGPPPPPTDRDIASRSGIPLQRYLAHLVRETFNNGHQVWRVEAEEVEAGETFLDMLLCGIEAPPTARIAVEVKRFVHSKEDRPMRLVFLAPPRDSRAINAPAIFPYVDPGSRDRGTAQPHHLLAGNAYYSPDYRECPVAEHCVPEERSGNVTMDDIARDLLQQMQALSRVRAGTQCFTFVPVVVTNAELRLLRIGQVDLMRGVPQTGNEDGEVVKWLRYEKTLSTTGLDPRKDDQPKDFAGWAADRLRTVFVVQAQHFIEFLRKFGVARHPWKP